MIQLLDSRNLLPPGARCVNLGIAAIERTQLCTCRSSCKVLCSRAQIYSFVMMLFDQCMFVLSLVISPGSKLLGVLSILIRKTSGNFSG